MLFDKIILLAKHHGWKQQICGITGISGSIGTNFFKNGKILSLSMVEEGQITYPDCDELKEMFGSYKMVESKPVVFNDEHYFGHCSTLEHDNYYLNVHRAHWMVCDKCRIKWLIGANLFSSWRKQNEIIWNANAEKLRKYREVNPGASHISP